MTKDATRLKLTVTGVALMVVAAVLWVAVISWGWAASGRSNIFLVLRCIWSVGFAVLYVTHNQYWRAITQRPPLRAWRTILDTLVATWLTTIALVHILLKWYPDALSSIRCVFIYTMALILVGIWAPVQYYAVRYYRRRKGTLSDDHTCCSDDSKKT